MKTENTTVQKLLGSITALCAIGIIILKILTHGDMDSYIMPLILLCMSGVIFNTKPSEKKQTVTLSTTQGKIILSLLLIVLTAGIVAFFIAL